MIIDFRFSSLELVVLDTVPLKPEMAATGKVTQLSVGPLLAQAIYNIHNKKSISALFKWYVFVIPVYWEHWTILKEEVDDVT